MRISDWSSDVGSSDLPLSRGRRRLRRGDGRGGRHHRPDGSQAGRREGWLISRRLARISPEAATWLKAEIAYIADWNPAAAKKVAERFRAARANLADYPNIGSSGFIPGPPPLLVRPSLPPHPP